MILLKPKGNPLKKPKHKKLFKKSLKEKKVSRLFEVMHFKTTTMKKKQKTHTENVSRKKLLTSYANIKD